MTVKDATVRLLFGALLAAGSLSASAGSHEDGGDLGVVTCKEVMILSGADRDTTIAFFHGYLLGKHGGTKVDLDRLTDATEAFLNKCLDNPTAKAVATMEALVIE